MTEILELETRRKIFDIIAQNPGLHLSRIAELLDMRVSLVSSSVHGKISDNCSC